MNLNPNSSSRHVVAEIESLLTQPAQVTQTAVESAHRRLAEAISRANERLTSAHRLISSGRRSEAIEIAERTPHVLDEVAILNAQVVQDWEHWSYQFGLPRFQTLRSDLASVVQGACTAENRVEHLLRRHRLLALGRANLRQRIAVLDQLATSDRSNPNWNKSLAQYQRARLEQLADRAKQARKLKDLRCMRRVMAELRQTRWLTTTSKTQIDGVQKHLHVLEQREATMEAIALAEHIQDAKAAGDSARLALLVKRWREIEPRLDDKSLGDVLPTIRSLIEDHTHQRQQQHAAETQEHALQLIGGINTNAPAEEIQSVINGIAASGAKVPVELRQSYVQRVQKDSLAKRRKSGLMIAAIAAAVIALAAVAGVAFVRLDREARLTALSDSIDGFLKTGELDAAERLLEATPEQDERFVELRQQVRQKQAAEKERATKFQDDGDALRSEIEAATEVDQLDRLAGRVKQFADRARRSDEDAKAAELSRLVNQQREKRKTEFIEKTQELNATIRLELKGLATDGSVRPKLTQWNLELQRQRTNRWIREESELLQALDETSVAIADHWDAIREVQ